VTRIVFAIPGDLSSPTGGYGYDRRVLAELTQCGAEAAHLALPASFPNPSARDVAETVAAINRAAGGRDVVLFDDLAYGALPEQAIHSLSPPIVGLCHHPLCLEAGLSPGRAETLRESERRALALAAHVVVTSAPTKAALLTEFALPPGKISVAPPGTDKAPRARGSGGAPAMLAVGSIIPRKAFDLLIEALVELQDRDWRLRIVGSVEASPQTALALQRQIAAAGLGRRVQLLGAVSAPHLESAFDTSDIFVSASLYEGYGMALAEALARGLPIVTTTAGAAAETVPDGAALKVPAGDVASLRAALRQILADGSLRQKLSKEAWRAGQSLPEWGDAARVIADVARKVEERAT
jgi:glycosyltransferase involved in cell wall biosynthesis